MKLNELKYDPTNPKSIEEYAVKLKNKTFLDVINEKGNDWSDISSGDITGNNVKINNIDSHVVSGNLELRGQLNRKSKFTCDTGDIELKLDGNVKDYYYELNGDDIEINKLYYGVQDTNSQLDKAVISFQNVKQLTIKLLFINIIIKLYIMGL